MFPNRGSRRLVILFLLLVTVFVHKSSWQVKEAALPFKSLFYFHLDFSVPVWLLVNVTLYVLTAATLAFVVSSQLLLLFLGVL